MEGFEEVGIEYRPVVSGNLLKQPFLREFRMERENPNVRFSMSVVVILAIITLSVTMK